MWLWILGILIILAVWALWFVFPPDPETGGGELIPTWLAITVTVVVLGLLIALWLVRRIRAARAARALEKVLREQAQEQALKAKPEESEEIRALYRQLAEGINSLKASKLGGGKKGDQALYALPWYTIVGPPGAGKTTALRYSGLQFPFLDPQSGGVRGVGGTRNCDWWFTNEAILLDTAGRYTTESDDRDEWIAFLEQLMKYRPEKPLNGVLVAVSVSELLDASEDQIRSVAGKVRARIDEMQATLKMTLPVYVIFTKTDLVAGFVEFFGDLKKSERGQPWGATYNLREAKTEPGKLFDREFDLLVERLHERVTKRMMNERSRPSKERIYQFPLEFAAIKRNLSDFMQAAFAPGLGVEPVLRGFYFSSGTQEGKPLDRVVGAMGRAFGLKGSVQEETEQKESRSYFLKDVFEKVVFPDQAIAAMSQAEVRRRLFSKLAFAAGAVILATLFTVPALISYLNNRALVQKTDKIATDTGKIDWTRNDTSAFDKVQKLDDLRLHLEQLKDWNDNGKPISYSWFMYKGEDLFVPSKELYLSSLQEGFVKPTKQELERRVDAVTGQDYLSDYNNLKTYLLLGDTQRLKEQEYLDFEIGRLTQVWGEMLARSSGGGVSEDELKRKIAPHVSFYVKLLRDGEAPPLTLEAKTVEGARNKLRNANQEAAYYDLFVKARNEEKIDETKTESDPSNLKYPPITLADVFNDRSEVGTILSSKDARERNKEWKVEGAFTAPAFKVIDKLLAEEAAKLLEREAWVVPYGREEKLAQAEIDKRLKSVRRTYEDAYIQAWTKLFEDVAVKIPQTNAEAIVEYKILSTPDWPYKRLIQTLSDHTQFIEESKAPASLTADGGIIDQIQKRVQRRFESGSGIRVEELQAQKDIPSKERIKRTFENVVKFGITPPYVPPQPLSDGTRPPEKPPADPELNKYAAHLEKLASEMQVIEEGPLNTETIEATKLFTTAVKDTEAMVLKLDARGQGMMREMLLNPLRQGYKAFIKGAGGAASGLWEVMVWPHYRDKIKDRYPFNLAAKRDASWSDAVMFFKPKEGVLWGFYDKYLGDFHRKQEHDFIPVSFLSGASEGSKSAKPAPKKARGGGIFNPLMYNCLKRSDEITDALWPDAQGEEPEVTFQINVKTVSPIVSDVVFIVDDQKRVYRNEKEFWYEFKWPSGDKRGASIQLRGAGGLDEEIVRDGPWGIFRLFESADSITAVKDSDEQFLVTWTMSAPPVTVTLQVRPKRGNHPFPLSFFRNTNCPPTIGDKFGPGGG